MPIASPASTANAIADTSGNGYNGTNVNGTFSTDTPLGSGHSLDFFGGNKYAWVTTGGNETVFGGGDAFTVAVWYKRLPDNDWETLISKRGETQVGWKIAKMNTAHVYFYTRGTTGGMDPRTSNYSGSGSINPADGSWHHVAVVHGYQGVKQRVYFDLYVPFNPTFPVINDRNIIIGGIRYICILAIDGDTVRT